MCSTSHVSSAAQFRIEHFPCSAFALVPRLLRHVKTGSVECSRSCNDDACGWIITETLCLSGECRRLQFYQMYAPRAHWREWKIYALKWTWDFDIAAAPTQSSSVFMSANICVYFGAFTQRRLNNSNRLKKEERNLDDCNLAIEITRRRRQRCDAQIEQNRTKSLTESQIVGGAVEMQSNKKNLRIRTINKNKIQQSDISNLSAICLTADVFDSLANRNW